MLRAGAASSRKLASFLNTLPSHPIAQSSWRIGEGPRFEALAIPASVNYVGKGGNLYRLGLRPSGAAHVVVKYLRTTWLTYRDPNLLETLDIYDQTAGFLKQSGPDEAELLRNIVGTIGDIDTYQLPDAKGFTSMQRYLAGESDDICQRRRDEILGAGVAEG